MSTLTGGADIASEVSTGARKKTKKVNLPHIEDTSVDPVREQLQALSVHSTLTNGTTDHSNSGSTLETTENCSAAPVNTINSDSRVDQGQHCSDRCSEDCTSKLHIIENLEAALGFLEDAIAIGEQHKAAAAGEHRQAAAQTAAGQRDDIEFVSYQSELQMAEIMRLIQKDLSEPYSIYTYRYFIHNWPKLCFLAMHEQRCIGAIVCKLDLHRNVRRGYIAMLAVDEKYRKRKIGSKLVRQAIQAMIQDNADEVVLETEITNKPALRLYENLGFVRDKRLFRYYLNGVDALRLKLWLR